MHIHGATGNNLAALVPTQSAQQLTATRKAAAAVRRRLAGVASSLDSGFVSQVDAYTPGERQRQASPQDPGENTFRAILVSMRG
jgi:hypothetical protein